MRSAPNNVAVQMTSWKCYFARMVHGESLQHLAGANGVAAHSGTNGARGPFKLAVKTSIDDGTTWNLSELFEISPPTYSLTRTPWLGINFITTHTLNSEWFHVKEDTMLSFTEHRCTILLRHLRAVRHTVTIPFGGALCNGDEVNGLCILWQGMGFG